MVTSQDKTVVLGFPAGDVPSELRAIADARPEAIHFLDTKPFSAHGYTIQAIVALTPTVVAGVTSIIITCIRAKRHISVKMDGIELSGLSADEIARILHERAHVDPGAEPS